MSKAAQAYALSIGQTMNAIKVGGHKRTVLIQGHMGTGKSSILHALAAALPTHTPCYFDCTTKDLGDITIPNLHVGQKTHGEYVSFATNEELGVHLDKPIILMIDEYGKANPAVKNSMLRLMLERKIGQYTLHPESIIFATTNLGVEGVGDLLPPHARNRLSVVTMRKPTQIEWIEWGINNEIDPAILGWVKDNPQLFQTFEEVKNVDENPYIYHPKKPLAAFVTPRSLESASDWTKLRSEMDPVTLAGLLIGTIGERGAMDLNAFIQLADQLPSLESIKKTPKTATVPKSPAAVCMVVYRSLSALDESWMENWMEYLERLDKEAQSMFVNGARVESYSKRPIVAKSKKFAKWCVENNFLFSADKT